MSDKITQAEAEDRLWKAIEHGQHTGMLGAAGQHFQPMTAFVERETGQIWFFTKKDADLVVAVAGGAPATFVFQSAHLWACIDGTLRAEHDRDRIERYWNVHVAAWYPEGKDDPSLTLICLDASEAAVWVAEGGPVKYAFEVAKANATKTTPDIGERRDLNFH